MPEPLFPILGTETPPLLGRAETLDRIIRNLTKQAPSHLSVVGPRYSGKTVILNEIRNRLNTDESPYNAVILWDLGHQTPQSDSDFLALLQTLLADALNQNYPQEAAALRDINGGDYSELKEVLQVLNEDGVKVLMLWDGFDRALGSGLLTRNLWDQLRELASLPILRLVTATRRKMIELLRSEDSATSDFWGIFDPTPVRVERFNDDDCTEILSYVESMDVEPGARSELENLTAGFPPLFLSLLNQLATNHEPGSINNNDVNRASEQIEEQIEGIIGSLWQDCPIASQDLFRHLLANGNTSLAGLNREDLNWLLERGFATLQGNKVSPCCRLLSKHLETHEQGNVGIAHLFGSWDSYCSNIREVLERRLSQLTSPDERLARMIRRSFEDIPDYPEDCLSNLTNIEERSLDLILQYEFGDDRILPQGNWDMLHRMDARNRFVDDLRDFVERPIPGDRLLQLRLLGLITGSAPRFTRIATFATKDMYVLIDAIHSFRNRTEHADGEAIDVGVAIAALMLCIELLACFEKLE